MTNGKSENAVSETASRTHEDLRVPKLRVAMQREQTTVEILERKLAQVHRRQPRRVHLDDLRRNPFVRGTERHGGFHHDDLAVLGLNSLALDWEKVHCHEAIFGEKPPHAAPS